MSDNPRIEDLRRRVQKDPASGLAKNDPELEQTVADLAQRLGLQKRIGPKDGLSLEQVHRENTARVPAPAPPPALQLDSVRTPRRCPDHDRALRTAVLVQWLAAIHVTRPNASP